MCRSKTNEEENKVPLRKMAPAEIYFVASSSCLFLGLACFKPKAKCTDMCSHLNGYLPFCLDLPI
jgi:hypothetical protein